MRRQLGIIAVATAATLMATVPLLVFVVGLRLQLRDGTPEVGWHADTAFAAAVTNRRGVLRGAVARSWSGDRFQRGYRPHGRRSACSG
jgi:hypothetical protein